MSVEAKAGRLSAAAFLLFAFLAVALFRLQILKGEYYRGLSEKNRLRLVYLEAPRGRMIDRNGTLLADSRLSFNCTAVLREPKATITIARKDERWTIAERGGFPADVDKVRDFVVKAMALKIGQSEPIGEKDRARLLLDAGGTAIEFLGAGGKPLARLTAGKKYFKTEPENAEKANGDGRYVALPGDEKRVIVVSDPLSLASTRSADWISKAGFAA